jgi:hypothetical protein
MKLKMVEHGQVARHELCYSRMAATKVVQMGQPIIFLVHIPMHGSPLHEWLHA